jgi:serine O-acetyltransferase
MAFQTSLTAAELTAYLGRLLAHLVPDGIEQVPAREHVDRALERLERCFAGIHRKYYTLDGSAAFDHLNGDHLATFLYFVSNTVFEESGDVPTATKLFAANKALHGLDLFYSVRMPEVFMLAHPVGSVIGAAEYGEELFVTQNCTIGNIDGAYPRLGRGVALYAGATVIGDVEVGDDVVFGARSFVVDTVIPSHSVVVGAHPGHRILPNHRPVHERVFRPPTGGI